MLASSGKTGAGWADPVRAFTAGKGLSTDRETQILPDHSPETNAQGSQGPDLSATFRSCLGLSSAENSWKVQDGESGERGGGGCHPGGVDQEEQAGHTGVTPRSPSQRNFLYPSPHFSGPLFPHLHSANHARAPRTASVG